MKITFDELHGDELLVACVEGIGESVSFVGVEEGIESLKGLVEDNDKERDNNGEEGEEAGGQVEDEEEDVGNRSSLDVGHEFLEFGHGICGSMTIIIKCDNVG